MELCEWDRDKNLIYLLYDLKMAIKSGCYQESPCDYLICYSIQHSTRNCTSCSFCHQSQHTAVNCIKYQLSKRHDSQFVNPELVINNMVTSDNPKFKIKATSSV